MRKSTACLAVAAALVSIGALGGGAAADEPLRVTQPVRATEFDVSPGRTYGSPGFAVDPEDPTHIVATTAELRTKRCGLMRSTDAGQTWTALDASPSPPNYPFCLMTNSHTTQGKVAFGRDHVLYYALNGWDAPDGANRSILLGRSTDFGESWQTTVVHDARGRTGEEEQPNRPISGLAVDTSGAEDVVYVSWRQQFRIKDPNARPPLPVMAVSSDGGRSFAAPVDLTGGTFQDAARRAEALKTTSTTAAPPPPATTPTTAATTPTTESASPLTPTTVSTTTTAPPPGSNAAEPNLPVNFGGSNPVVAVDDEGTVYSAWVTSFDNITPAPHVAHFLTRSSDRGRTLEVLPLTPFSAENVNTFGGLSMVWSPEGGDDGTLHLVYEGSRNPEVANEADVFYRRSTDRGQRWSDPVAINTDEPENLFFSGVPAISVAPDGRLDVAWFDTRDDPGTTSNDVYYASSADNGLSWSDNIRVSDQSIDRKIGVYASRFDLNAPPGIASTEPFALIGWDDTRGFDALTQGQDIMISAVQYAPVAPATSNVVKYLLAGVIGLVAVGAVFLILALLARRRSGGPGPSAPSRPDRTPVGVG